MWTSPRIRTCVAIVMIATLAAPSTARAAAPDFDALRTRSPYVPLWTQVVACHRVEHVNGLTGDVSDRRLDALVRWFGHFNSQVSNRFLLGRDCIGSSTSTLATKLAARGVWVSTYRNGSSTSQSNPSANLNFYEAGDLEATAPLAIGTFLPGD